jgi:hypothetical protein
MVIVTHVTSYLSSLLSTWYPWNNYHSLISVWWNQIWVRRVWRYQRGNQNLYIEEQTTQKKKRTNSNLQNINKILKIKQHKPH